MLRLAALTGEHRYANHADRILQLLGTVIEQAPGGTSECAARRSSCDIAAWSSWRSSATLPIWFALAQVLWRPDLVLAWGEPYDSPLWEGRSEGLAYVCRDYVCEAARQHP